MLLHTRTPGGRSSRRLLIAAATLLLGVAATVRPALADERPDVAIGRDGDAYTVAARFRVPHPSALVLSVLSDYDDIPRFVPDVKKSAVIETRGAVRIVEQEAVSHVMMFSKRVRLQLVVEETSDSLTFRDQLGTSFARYEGRWNLAACPDGTIVSYRLVAEPSFSVPGFLIRRLLSRDAGDMIDSLRAEMDARATRR